MNFMNFPDSFFSVAGPLYFCGAKREIGFLLQSKA